MVVKNVSVDDVWHGVVANLKRPCNDFFHAGHWHDCIKKKHLVLEKNPSHQKMAPGRTGSW